MPAKDKFFDAVLKALEADGWTITDEEFYLPFALRSAYIDILAEKPVTAERAGRQIAVEVKTFGGTARMSELEKAIGQFVIYKTKRPLPSPDSNTTFIWRFQKTSPTGFNCPTSPKCAAISASKSWPTTLNRK